LAEEGAGVKKEVRRLENNKQDRSKFKKALTLYDKIIRRYTRNSFKKFSEEIGRPHCSYTKESP
jgi:hypothetical protein